MQQVASQLAVLVTASVAGEYIRRRLAQDGLAMHTSTASLSRLRRALVRGEADASVVLCVTLDAATLRRHGSAVRRMLEDRDSFASPVRAIGVMIDGLAAEGWMAMGCDAIASDAAHLRWLLSRFEPAEARSNVHARRSIFRSGPSAAGSTLGTRRSANAMPDRAGTRIEDLQRPRQ